MSRSSSRSNRRRPHRLVARVMITAGLALAALAAIRWDPGLAQAAPTTPNDHSAGGLAAPADLKSVIDNLRNWLIGMLVALATLALTIGGVRYLLASGDPGEVNKAKETLKYAAVGYGVAALAPVLVAILKKIVGA